MAVQRLLRTPGRRGALQPPRSRAFFLELLLNLFIFGFCAVVALQVFVEGKLITDDSAALGRLTLDAEALAEEYKAARGGIETLQLGEAQGVLDADGVLTYYYNKALETTDAEDASYRLVLTPNTDEGSIVDTLEIAAYENDEELFALEVARHLPSGGS